MSDPLTALERGLTRLLERMGSDHPRYTEALTLQSRLLENISATRIYGDTETRRAERAQTVEALNQLALEVTGVSFNELCGLPTKPSSRMLRWKAVARRYWLPLAASVLAVGLGAFYLLDLGRQAPDMGAGFNIAIAPFHVVDETDHRITSPDGQFVSDFIAKELNQKKDALLQGLQPEVWGPDRVDMVTDVDQAERLADQINAHLLIYGGIRESSGTTTVFPKFLVSLPSTRFEDAAEILGEHRLGSPIGFGSSLSDPFNQAHMGRVLGARIEALILLARGMHYYQSGDFAAALVEFAKAASGEEWTPDEGKEVLYLFMGNAANRSGDAQLAQSYYETALSINPTYARALLGRGAALLAQGRATGETDPDLSKLTEAEGAFQRALELWNDEPSQGSYVDVKAHFSLGEIYLERSWFGGDDMWDSSRAEYQWVIKAYRRTEDPMLLEFAAHAHARVGLLSLPSIDTPNPIAANMCAVEEFRQAISLLRRSQSPYDRQWTPKYEVQLAGIYEGLADYQSAAEWLTCAVEHGSDSESYEDWKGRLDSVLDRLPPGSSVTCSTP
jgi:tetratricopeptide (TPR) repeat protein